MAKTRWQDLTNPDEIMERISNLISVDKWIALYHFGYRKDDEGLEIFKGLLYKYFTPAELCEHSVYSYSVFYRGCNPKAKDILKDYASIAWKNLTDPKKILCYSVEIAEDDLHTKLNYFYDNNKEIFYKLLQVIETQKAIRILSENSEKFDDVIVSLLKEYPNNIKCFDIKYLKDKHRDLLYDALVKYPNNVFLISDREIVEDFLAKFPQILKIIREKIDWRELNNHELVMYQANEDNKWEILEYFAQKDPKVFRNIVKYYVKVRKAEKEGFYTYTELLERYDDEKLSTMPKVLVDYIQNLKIEIVDKENKRQERLISKREASEKRKLNELKSWNDEFGYPLILFKLGNIEVMGRENYLKILNKFIERDMTSKAFCAKYKISDSQGFKSMLDKFSAETPEMKEKIEQRLSDNKTKYISVLNRDLMNVLTGRESVGLLVNHSNAFPLKKLLDYLKEKQNLKRVLINRVVDYYYDRLNSYDESIEPDNIVKMLTKKEIEFLVGTDTFMQMMTGKSVDLSQEFYNIVRVIKEPSVLSKVNGYGADKIRTRLSKYNTRFKTNEYFRNKTILTLSNGEDVEISKEMVEMAYQFVNVNQIFPSNSIMNTTIRAVANGKIKNIEESLKDKEEMKKQILDLINEITDIEEYFAMMKKYLNSY